MELDDEEDDMVAVEVPNMWSKGKGVQDASRDPSQDHRNTVEIIDDQDVQSVNNQDNNDKTNKPTIHTDSKQQSKTNSQNKTDITTKDRPSGKKKVKKSSQIKEEIFKALEYDFESGKSNFTILIEPKTENVVKNETVQNQDATNA
jgi:hypothetical protein